MARNLTVPVLGCLALVVAGTSSADSTGKSKALNDRALEDRCRAEVLELHHFLEVWSNGELPETEEAFARFGDVIAPSFLIIDPDGETVARQPIVDAIRAAHGRWRATPGRIRIDNFRLHHSATNFALATYEEWHEVGGESIGRLSSVLFGPNDDAPNGLEWLHLHEVWIQGD